MRLKKYIEEEWAISAAPEWNRTKENIDVFVNPGPGDFKETGDICRFIADKKKKKLYIFNGRKLLHNEAHKAIYGSLNVDFHFFLWGVAEKRGGKWEMTESDVCDFGKVGSTIPPEKMKKDYSWVNKYINIDNFFDRRDPHYFDVRKGK